jgi:hypothetical protein
MEIAAFLSDAHAMHEWLEGERSAMDLRGEYLSWWLHGEGPGFGLVVVGPERSMEFHLMRDGSVQRILEEFDFEAQQFVTLLADSPTVASVSEFLSLYTELRERTLESRAR